MMATRTRPLTAKQRAVLEVLADGGVIIENPGCRGFMKSLQVFAKDAPFGVDVHPAVFRSLYSTFTYENPGLIEQFQPRKRIGGPFDFHFRITRAGRAALKIH